MIDKRLTLILGGVPREVTVDEALQHQTYRDAIAGNRAAQREILKMIAKREKARAARSNRTTPAVEIRTEPADPQNADAALLALGLASVNATARGYSDDRERLLLEPWAVQAALSRRRGGQRLTRREIAEIKRCTRDADTLRWPRGTEE